MHSSLVGEGERAILSPHVVFVLLLVVVVRPRLLGKVEDHHKGHCAQLPDPASWKLVNVVCVELLQHHRSDADVDEGALSQGGFWVARMCQRERDYPSSRSSLFWPIDVSGVGGPGGQVETPFGAGGNSKY